tara:strand:- start:16925 stop:17359 length:435 start_codon:yes stop_codon:yes gene_type:complete
MAVTYTNNWKNILTALKSKIRAEMKCPVYSDWEQEIKSNQFVKIVPTGSSQLEKATFMEVRSFEMDCQYFFVKRKDNKFQDYVLNQVSILEALIHDNITLTLADNTKAVDVTLGDLDFNVEVENYEDYMVAQWTLTCTHFGNTA